MLSLPLGHPTLASLSDHRSSSPQPRLPFRKQARRLLRPSGILSGFRGASGGQQSYPTLLCEAPASGGLRRAPRPPKAPPRATKGRLEPRTAPPVPELRESYRGELRGTRTQSRVTPQESASARGRKPLRERLSGAHSSHHLLRRFTKWPPARSAGPRSKRGGIEWLTSRARRRKRTDVSGLSPGSCPGLWRKEL